MKQLNKTRISTSPEETMRIGEEIAQKLKPGDCILLEGELGAGKTTFIKGVARGLGVKEEITSPSFILIREYEGRSGIPFYHVDAYRTSKVEEFEEVGLEEYLDRGIVAVEWGDKIRELLPNHIRVVIEIVDEGKRRIKLFVN
jgi:tRNA threonylcarbamoyladenosine biosynthesis protein TsaE